MFIYRRSILDNAQEVLQSRFQTTTNNDQTTTNCSQSSQLQRCPIFCLLLFLNQPAYYTGDKFYAVIETSRFEGHIPDTYRFMGVKSKARFSEFSKGVIESRNCVVQ